MSSFCEKGLLEWETIVECSALLIDSIKGNVDNIGNELHSKWFLSESEYESLKLTGPGFEPSVKARTIVSAVETKIKSKPALFSDFIVVLKGQGVWLQDCTKQVEECYKSKQVKSFEDSQDSPGFICPYCQKCTLEEFFMSGCPLVKAKKNPNYRLSQPRFPFLDTNHLTDQEKYILFDKLSTDYDYVVGEFRKLCLSLSKSTAFKEETDSIKLFLSASAIFSKEEKTQLMNSKKITDILMILLLERASFFNFQIIESLVNEYGSSDNKQDLQKYLTEFNSYCMHDVFEVPHAVFHPGKSDDIKHSTFALKYFEEGPIMLKQLTSICSRIAKTLHINPWALSLVSAQKGCLFLTFAVPTTIASRVLPIPDTQLIELSRYGLGVIDDEEDDIHENREIQIISSAYRYVKVPVKLEAESSTKHKEATPNEDVDDSTGDSAYGTGNAVREKWIQDIPKSDLSTSVSPVLLKKDGSSGYTSLIEAFKEKDTGPYTSLVKSDQNKSSETQQLPMGERYAATAHALCVDWLAEHFESQAAEEACYIPKTLLYGHYLRHCSINNIDPVSAVVLGKLVRSTFIGLSVKLLGSSGKLMSCYYGIRIKPHSPLFTASGTEMLIAVRSQSAPLPPPPLPYCPSDLLALRSSPTPIEWPQPSVLHKHGLSSNPQSSYPPTRSSALFEQLPPLPLKPDHQPTTARPQRLQSEPLPKPPPLPKPRQLSLHSKLH